MQRDKHGTSINDSGPIIPFSTEGHLLHSGKVCFTDTTQMSLEAKQKDTEHIEKTVVRDAEKAGDGDDGTEEAVDPGLESRFLEVRSAAVEEDDITMIAETFRAYAIGILLCGAAAAISDLADWREEPMVIDSSLVQLVALPIGKGWARYMPKWKIGTKKYFFNLNPGPFTIKEHTLIVAMANVATGYPPYALGLLISQITKYSNPFLHIVDKRSKFWIHVQPHALNRYGDDWLQSCRVVPQIPAISWRYDLAGVPSDRCIPQHYA